jgi:hypothetical protein
LSQLKNQHEGEKKGRHQRSSHPDVGENLSKELNVVMMMIMESRTPFIVCLGHDIACVQMNRLESKTFLQTITRGTDFNIQA